MLDQNAMRDSFHLAMSRGREFTDDFKGGIVGFGFLELFGPTGEKKLHLPFHNLITDAGDLYYASMAIALVNPAAPAQPTKVTGMKLGTGSTAEAKAGAGGALVTYEAGSNNLFDATFPSTTNLGAGLGVTAVYKTSWAAGDVTETALREAVIVNDAATDATSTAANTISRVVFAAVDKQAGDALAITWSHKFLGAAA